MAVLEGINEGYIKLSKWLQIDCGAPLGINFGRRKGIFICLLASQPRLCLPQQPSSEDGDTLKLSF